MNVVGRIGMVVCFIIVGSGVAFVFVVLVFSVVRCGCVARVLSVVCAPLLLWLSVVMFAAFALFLLCTASALPVLVLLFVYCVCVVHGVFVVCVVLCVLVEFVAFSASPPSPSCC